MKEARFVKHGREAKSDQTGSDHVRLFDPVGLFLVVVVGGTGGLLLLRHGWILGVPMVALASAGLLVSHKHFNPPDE